MINLRFVILEYMAASIKAELKRLQRRKQLQYSSTVDNSDGSSSGGEQSESSPSRPKDRPLFTFKQVCTFDIQGVPIICFGGIPYHHSDIICLFSFNGINTLRICFNISLFFLIIAAKS